MVQPKTDMCLSSPSHFSTFNCYVSFCSLIKGITPKIRMLCFVLINRVLLNFLCVWLFNYSRVWRKGSLIFYAQSTVTVISGRLEEGCRKATEKRASLLRLSYNTDVMNSIVKLIIHSPVGKLV